MPVLWIVLKQRAQLNVSDKIHCKPVWLRPSTIKPCICCKQVAEKPRGEHLPEQASAARTSSKMNQTQLIPNPELQSMPMLLYIKQKFLDKLVQQLFYL